jgi:hypothetical protein
LIDDDFRVFKGGSWKDVAYWLAPGTRRFLHQDSATNHIGFRCAMIAVGGKGPIKTEKNFIYLKKGPYGPFFIGIFFRFIDTNMGLGSRLFIKL